METRSLHQALALALGMRTNNLQVSVRVHPSAPTAPRDARTPAPAHARDRRRSLPQQLPIALASALLRVAARVRARATHRHIVGAPRCTISASLRPMLAPFGVGRMERRPRETAAGASTRRVVRRGAAARNAASTSSSARVPASSASPAPSPSPSRASAVPDPPAAASALGVPP